MTDFETRRRTMVDTQVRPSDVTSFPIIDAMLEIPRELFVPSTLREVAYLGESLDLGGGRTILDPRTLSKLLNALAVRPTQLVLDLGCAFGYSAAVLSRLAEAVVAVEPDEAMAGEAAAALPEVGADNAVVITADLTEGAPQHGPYDAILIEGAIQYLPDAIAGQLAEGGRIAAVFQHGTFGVGRLGWKIDGRVTWRDAFHANAEVLPGFAAQPEFSL